MNSSDIINNNLVITDSIDAPFTEDGEIVGLQTVVEEDWEQEQFRMCITGYEMEMGGWKPVFEEIPTWAFKDNTNCYFTTTGDNPVTRCQAEQADLLPRHEQEQAPNKFFYSISWKWGKTADRYYLQWMLAIHKTNEEKKLRRLWTHLWKRFFECKNNNEDFFLSPKQLKNVREAFEAKGIKARNSK